MNESNVTDLLEAVLLELKALRALLGRQRRVNTEVLTVLLPAVAGKFGSTAVTTREILQDVAIAAVVGDLSPSQVGALLATAADAGAAYGGYFIEKSGIAPQECPGVETGAEIKIARIRFP